MYKSIIRPIFFKLQPETAHGFVFKALKTMQCLPGGIALTRACVGKVSKPVEVFGMTFPNPVGLAAGLDKDAEVFDMFGALGFGFVEIGTITPKSQPGNPKPRLFRLIPDKSIINRMGFNNSGIENAVKNLRKKRTKVIIGGNIGKNKITPNEQAADDYVACFHGLFDHVDYFVVNVSSPNTPNLRELQDKEPLKNLLNTLQACNKQKSVQKPILLKIAPDLTDSQLDDIVEIVEETGIAGVVATNTTIGRQGLTTPASRIEEIGAGGLSGAVLKDRSTAVISYLHKKSGGRFPIIGVGGITNAADAREKLAAGASLVQVYTSFIYEGPMIVRNIVRAL